MAATVPKELYDFRNFLYLTWKHLGLPDPTPTVLYTGFPGGGKIMDYLCLRHPSASPRPNAEHSGCLRK